MDGLDENGLQQSWANFFKFFRCVLEKPLKSNDKLIVVCSPLINSLEIFVLLSFEGFVCEGSCLAMILAQF